MRPCGRAASFHITSAAQTDIRLAVVMPVQVAMDSNPYESPRERSSPIPVTDRFRDWLYDRIMLLNCGCVCFLVAWGVVMAAAYLFGAF